MNKAKYRSDRNDKHDITEKKEKGNVCGIRKKAVTCILASMLCFTYLLVSDIGVTKGEDENNEEFNYGKFRYRIIGDHEVEVSGVFKIPDMPSRIIIPETAISTENSMVYDVVSIGEEAFDSTGVRYLIAPSVTKIGDKAFSGSRIIKLELPSLTSIGMEAFSNCYYLTEANFPKLISIGDNAFTNCWTLAKLNLPQVTEIGDSAFTNCGDLVELNLPQVTKIGDNAFVSCSTLAKLNLPQVTEIGDSAFAYCSNIEYAEFPSLRTIGIKTFHSCSGLKDMSVPLLTDIPDEAFAGCFQLIELKAPQVRSVGNSSFQDCKGMDNIDLQSVVSIGNDAFVNCSELRSINIPNVRYVGDCAFGACSKLKIITIDDENERYSVGENGAALFNKNRTVLLAYPSVSGDYIVPETVTAIGAYAFYMCTDLKSVDMPAVTVIGAYAFRECRNLITVNATHIEYIGDFAFSGAYKMEPVDLTNVVYIGDNAFAGSREIITLDMPLVRHIGNGAFMDCTNLEKVDAPSVTYIGSYAFSVSMMIKTVNIPSATYIGQYAFSSCILLEKIDVPLVKYLGEHAFNNCKGLKEINLSSVEYMEPNPFEQIESLESLVISKNVIYEDVQFPKITEKILIDGNVIASIGSDGDSMIVKVYPKKGSTIDNVILYYPGEGGDAIVKTEEWTWIFDRGLSNTYVIKADTTDILVDVKISASEGKGTFRYRSEGKGEFLDVPEDGIIQVKIYTILEVKATSDKGYKFKGWSDGSSRSTLVIRSVDGDMTISAEFREKRSYKVTISSESGGKISYKRSGDVSRALPDDGYVTVEEEESIEITAIPDEGYEFVGWSGNGADAVLTISALEEDIELVAVFKRTSSSVDIVDPGENNLFMLSVAVFLAIALLSIVVIYIRRP